MCEHTIETQRNQCQPYVNFKFLSPASDWNAFLLLIHTWKTIDTLAHKAGKIYSRLTGVDFMQHIKL